MIIITIIITTIITITIMCIIPVMGWLIHTRPTSRKVQSLSGEEWFLIKHFTPNIHLF